MISTEFLKINPYVPLLYEWGYNLIPLRFAPGTKDHKKPIVKWKEYQTDRIKPGDMAGWMEPF
jgi:hypothetical protein